MKTKEQIFEEVVTPNGGGTLREKVYQAMQLYSDQQNKELRERIAVVLSDSALGVEIQRLTTENKELEEKLMSEQIENGYLQAFRVSNEAEIQRLTKEVEELKSTHLKLSDHNLEYALENIRLRKLLGRASQYIQVYGMGGDTAKQLLTDIDNTLNPKRAKQKRT